MTVQTTTRKQSFAGGQSTLTFTFKTLPDHPEYIKVVAVSSGTETLLTYSTQYTVSLEADGVGGTVTVSPSYSTSYTYTVYRETLNKQESDYDDYNQFPADTLEEDLDRRTLVAQDIDETLNRTVKGSISSALTGSSLELPTVVAGRAIKWNDAGTGLANSSGDIDDSVTEAANYASTASTQASAASVSAAAALVSENNAATSETAAGNYASTASTQATEAGNYASTASTQATAASNYASTASTEAIAAATSSTLAGDYASTASTQATLAGNYASTASTQATAAGNYASTASTQATAAGNYATSASTSAIAAATSATLAGNYATTASGAVLIDPVLASDHTFTGLRASMTAGTEVTFGDLVRLNSSGQVVLANASTIGSCSAVFLSSDINNGSSGTILIFGIARDDSWNWTPGQLLYVSSAGTTGSTITATAPTGTDQVIQVIGVATHADRIYFNPSLTQVEHT